MRISLKSFFFTFLCFCAWQLSAQNDKNKLPQLGKNAIKEVIATMTLDEKVRILVGPNYIG